MMPQGKYREVIHAQVKARADQFDQEQEMLLVSLVEGQATDIMTYDAIIKGIGKKLQRESKLEDKGQFFLFHDITNHRTIKRSRSSYEVLINWEYGHATWELVSVMRRDDLI